MRSAILLALVLVSGLACGGATDNQQEGTDSTTDVVDSKDVSANDTFTDLGSDSGVDSLFDTTELPETVTKKGPPYPIVLAHGFFGFEDFAGIGFVTYFFGVKDDLAGRGESLVFTPAVDPFNNSTARGAQLVKKIEEILATTGHAKVHIIGHSQGGLDARVVAHDRPDLVASVITVGTPHGGAAVADIGAKLVADERFASLVDALVKVIGGRIWTAAGEKSSFIKGLEQFTKPAVKAFDLAYPDSPGIPYFSVAGRTALNPGTVSCATRDAPAFITKFDGVLDTTDVLLQIPEAISAGGVGEPNDGLVRVKDAKHGTFLGCIPADHLDEMGQLFGDSPGPGNKFSHKQFYADLVFFLRAKGL